MFDFRRHTERYEPDQDIREAAHLRFGHTGCQLAQDRPAGGWAEASGLRYAAGSFGGRGKVERVGMS